MKTVCKKIVDNVKSAMGEFSDCSKEYFRKNLFLKSLIPPLIISYTLILPTVAFTYQLFKSSAPDYLAKAGNLTFKEIMTEYPLSNPFEYARVVLVGYLIYTILFAVVCWYAQHKYKDSYIEKVLNALKREKGKRNFRDFLLIAGHGLSESTHVSFLDALGTVLKIYFRHVIAIVGSFGLLILVTKSLLERINQFNLVEYSAMLIVTSGISIYSFALLFIIREVRYLSIRVRKTAHHLVGIIMVSAIIVLLSVKIAKFIYLLVPKLSIVLADVSSEMMKNPSNSDTILPFAIFLSILVASIWPIFVMFFTQIVMGLCYSWLAKSVILFILRVNSLKRIIVYIVSPVKSYKVLESLLREVWEQSYLGRLIQAAVIITTFLITAAFLEFLLGINLEKTTMLYNILMLALLVLLVQVVGGAMNPDFVFIVIGLSDSKIFQGIVSDILTLSTLISFIWPIIGLTFEIHYYASELLPFMWSALILLLIIPLVMLSILTRATLECHVSSPEFPCATDSDLSANSE